MESGWTGMVDEKGSGGGKQWDIHRNLLPKLFMNVFHCWQQIDPLFYIVHGGSIRADTLRMECKVQLTPIHN
jgi:hypothetical protein